MADARSHEGWNPDLGSRSVRVFQWGARLAAPIPSKFTAPHSFYRTPTLVSIWATAPYLHNNSLGIYTGDPSIAGRMVAYEDGMTKLL